MEENIMRSPTEMRRRLKSRYARLGIALLVLVLLPAGVSAQIEITLKNSFIEKFKNRVTVDTTFTVDKAHKKPNPPKKMLICTLPGERPRLDCRSSLRS